MVIVCWEGPAWPLSLQCSVLRAVRQCVVSLDGQAGHPRVGRALDRVVRAVRALGGCLVPAVVRRPARVLRAADREGRHAAVGHGGTRERESGDERREVLHGEVRLRASAEAPRWRTDVGARVLIYPAGGGSQWRTKPTK
jgi:hypothetical protein